MPEVTIGFMVRFYAERLFTTADIILAASLLAGVVVPAVSIHATAALNDCALLFGKPVAPTSFHVCLKYIIASHLVFLKVCLSWFWLLLTCTLHAEAIALDYTTVCLDAQ